jgi:ABC-type amino acid transport system permease subunit
VLLTVLTMLVAVPAGIVLALMRLSSSKVLAGASQASWSSFATCR